MAFWVALLLLQAPVMPDLPTVERNPHTSAQDVAQGKRLYDGRCAGCHGPTGDAGKGANLAIPELPRGVTDLALWKVIRYGIPDTEMPGSLMTPREIWQVAAYVRTLGRISGDGVKGDAVRGEAVARGKGGCLGCHSVGLDGGSTAPSLSDAGARRSPAHLRQKLLDPNASTPDSFRIVSLKTRDGRAVTGQRLNEDTWSIQVRDGGGRLLSFQKDALLELKKERRSPMPSYQGALTAAEIEDVVAWLAGLRGVR